MAGRALVVGGTGQIGVASVHALTEAGWEVAATARGHRPAPPDLAAEVLVVDREDTAALARAAQGRDLVVDTMAFTPEHARQLLTLDAGALVVISTAAVYQGANGTYLDVATDAASYPDYPVPIDEDWPTIDNAEPSYSPLKAAMERVLRAGTLPVSILRAGAVHGPRSVALREWFVIKRVLDGRTRVLLAWDGKGRFHPAATANIAALVAACAAQPGTRVLNAVDDECPDDAEIARTIADAMGHPLEVVTFPGPPRGEVGASPWSAPKPFVLSMDRAHTELGYRPAMSYAAAVATDIDWAVRAVRDAESTGGSWHDVFGDLVGWGADQWFDYAAEDGVDLGR